MSIKALQDYTYCSKYARYKKEEKRRETWNEAVNRVRDMHLKKYEDRIQLFPEVADDINWAFEQVRAKKVLGSQRSLQFGGEPILKKNARMFNCFSEDTNFITSEGVKSFKDFTYGDTCNVLSHDGIWNKAIVKSYGKQKLYEITITQNDTSYKIKATKDHRWILKNGEETTSLSVGDHLISAPNIFDDFVYEESSIEERLYWAYGYVYGDGTKVMDSKGVHKYRMVRLCIKENKYTERFRELGFFDSPPSNCYLKTLPDPSKDSPELIKAFVRGYLDAYGTKNRSKPPNYFEVIQATGEESIEFIRTCFPVAGIYIVSEKDISEEITNFDKRNKTVLFRIKNCFKENSASFLVSSIKELYEEKVWCLEVENSKSFVMPFGLSTGNCVASYCDRIRFFQEAFWLLLCGSGTGFSVQKHHIAKLPEFSNKLKTNKEEVFFKGEKTYVILDSIEGWSDALGVLLASYFYHSEFSEYEGYYVNFDYSKIRPAGSFISSGSGKAPGPEPLERSIEIIRRLIDRCFNNGQKRLRPIDAYDIVMHASDAVLSGGVRRSATICIFSLDDKEMMEAKTGNWFVENPQRARSNNSVLLLRDKVNFEQFRKIIESVRQFGEPGFLWSDSTEQVFNPCVEVGFWPVDEITRASGWQACNLTEQNGRKIKSKEDWTIAAKAASIIGTLQAGYTDFDYLGDITKRIIEREALLGVSITGMMDNPDLLFNPEIQREMAKIVLDTNADLAPKLGIKLSARTTCIKPSGCRPIESLTSTSKGILTLEELIENHDIREEWDSYELENKTHGGKITKTYINGFSDVVKINLKYGIELICTPNHRWYVDYSINRNLKSQRFKVNDWVEAKYLKFGDVLDVKLGAYNKLDHSALNKEYRLKDLDKHNFSCNEPKNLNNDICWLLGYLWSNSCIKQSKYRINFIDQNETNLIKVSRILKENFNIDVSYNKLNDQDAYSMGLGNKLFCDWLLRNEIYKYEKDQIALIPRVVRESSYDDILAFIAGLIDSDGCVYMQKMRNGSFKKSITFTNTNERFSNHFQHVAMSVGVLFSKSLKRYIENKQKIKNIWLMNLSNHVIEKNFALLAKNSTKIQSIEEIGEGCWGHSISYPNIGILGKVHSIEDFGKINTFDIETDEHWFYAGAIKSHNTASCILGTGSGIHPHHSKRYIRRVQANSMETPLQWLKKFNPSAVEKSVWSANKTDEIISFCIEVPDGAKMKNDLSAIDLLEHVKSTQQNWISAGKRPELCTQDWLSQNVSNTVNVKGEEWDEVAKYIYLNRKYFAGISLLPISGDKDYPQAPFCAIYSPRELIQMYGDGMPLASGLIVDGLHAFGDLWKACDAVLGLGEKIEKPDFPPNETHYSFELHKLQTDKYDMKIDWIRRAKQFAERYFNNDVRKMTYCLKDVNNWKTWLDLNREYKDVDYSEMFEEEDNTNFRDTSACAGGKCELR